jgi:hypothetical protein
MKKNDATNHFCIVGCAYSGMENDVRVHLVARA